MGLLARGEGTQKELWWSGARKLARLFFIVSFVFLAEVVRASFLGGDAWGWEGKGDSAVSWAQGSFWYPWTTGEASLTRLQSS
jgi:hypothetical protein